MTLDDVSCEVTPEQARELARILISEMRKRWRQYVENNEAYQPNVRRNEQAALEARKITVGAGAGGAA